MFLKENNQAVFVKPHVCYEQSMYDKDIKKIATSFVEVYQFP